MDAAHGKGGEFGAVQKVHGQELPQGGRVELRVHQRNNISDFHENTFAIFLSPLLSICSNNHGSLSIVSIKF